MPFDISAGVQPQSQSGLSLMNATVIFVPLRFTADPVCVPTPPVGVTPVMAKTEFEEELDGGISEELVTSFATCDIGVVELPLRLPFR